jgi:hypothetical protein
VNVRRALSCRRRLTGSGGCARANRGGDGEGCVMRHLFPDRKGPARFDRCATARRREPIGPSGSLKEVHCVRSMQSIDLQAPTATWDRHGAGVLLTDANNPLSDLRSASQSHESGGGIESSSWLENRRDPRCHTDRIRASNSPETSSHRLRHIT